MSTTYRDDLLAVSAVILGDGTTDRDIHHAIDLADRLIRQVDKFVLAKQTQTIDVVKQTLPAVTPARCQSGRDGDCNWSACPQLRDNEPAATRRHCPLDDGEDGYE